MTPFAKIDAEMEPFKVNGCVLASTRMKWLESKGAIRIGDNGEIFVKPDKGEGKIQTKTYQAYLKEIEEYLYVRKLQEVGGMGITKSLGVLEDLPF